MKVWPEGRFFDTEPSERRAKVEKRIKLSLIYEYIKHSIKNRYFPERSKVGNEESELADQG